MRMIDAIRERLGLMSPRAPTALPAETLTPESAETAVPEPVAPPRIKSVEEVFRDMEPRARELGLEVRYTLRGNAVRYEDGYARVNFTRDAKGVVNICSVYSEVRKQGHATTALMFLKEAFGQVISTHVGGTGSEEDDRIALACAKKCAESGFLDWASEYHGSWVYWDGSTWTDKPSAKPSAASPPVRRSLI